MNSQKIITTTVENEKSEIIKIRQCSEPSEAVLLVYEKLKFKPIPLPRKKSVWHTGEFLKNDRPVNQYIMDG